MALQVIKDVRRIEATNEINSVSIQYTATKGKDDAGYRVNARLSSEDSVIGNITVEPDGRFYVSMDATNSLTEEQKSGIVTTVLNDSKTLSDPDTIEG